MTRESPGCGRECLRHVLAVIAYRGGKVVKDVSESTARHRVSPDSRTPLEILSHINDLLDWGRWLARGEQKGQNTTPRSWTEEVARFHSELAAFDAELTSGSPLGSAPERLLQGPLADVLTHVGQIAYIRRVVGQPVRGENYFVADIEAGRLGPAQAEPRREFD